VNNQIINQYGITFSKRADKTVDVFASSDNLAIYLGRSAYDKQQIINLISYLNLAISGQYATIAYNDTLWPRDLGGQCYMGSIENATTFELYMADFYEETIETFPLTDMKEILQSLLEFIG